MDAIEYLYGLEFHGHKFGLENIRAILSGLGDPQRAFRSVIVAGTNGKGSVCAMTAAALTAAGHRTGRYTSPHLIRLEERVAIDGVDVDRLELDEALGRVRTAIDGLLSFGRLRAQPTFFEVVTATAFEIFRDRRVEVAVLEVGLGGRLDATNVVSPVAGAITTIDLEHQRYLGDTLAQIAAEKAGIVKPGLPVVCGERKPEAVNVIAATCRAKDAELILAWEGVDLIAADAGGQSAITVRTPTRAYPPFTLGLAGLHQIQNALVAVRLLETLDAAGLAVPAAAVGAGLQHPGWRGRLELVHLPNGRRLLLDAAHNPAGAASLAAYLRAVFPAGVSLVFGAMADKDHEAMLRVLLPCAIRVIATTAPSNRAAPAADLARLVTLVRPEMAVLIEPDPGRALDQACRIGGDVCVAGSIFLVGAVLPLLPADSSA